MSQLFCRRLGLVINKVGYWKPTVKLISTTQHRRADEKEGRKPAADPTAESDGPTKEIEELKEQITLIDNKYKRVLADMENLRQRTYKEMDDTKKFAILKFCKDLIEIPDTMSLALQNIKPEEVGEENFKGVSMINDRAINIFQRHGLISINPIGQKFDPNKHQAMFEIPDASKEPGTVGQVVKIGWELHDRIVRPAMVGVIKKP